jgi:hypothetical protein
MGICTPTSSLSTQGRVVSVDDPTEPRPIVESKEPGKHRRSYRDDWDPRFVLALVVILGAFFLAGVALAQGKDGATIPAWVAVLTGGIGIYYFKNGKEK